MTLSRASVRKNLPKKGFKKENRTKHDVYYFERNGIKTGIRFIMSRGSGHKTLGNDIISSMAYQCKVSTKIFRDLVKCTVSYEDYVVLLDQNEKNR